MIEGSLGRVQVGDLLPVRIMAVINLSRESFYSGSVAMPDKALAQALAMQEKGTDLIDIGAVSMAPGSPPISESRSRSCTRRHQRLDTHLMAQSHGWRGLTGTSSPLRPIGNN